MDGVVVLPAQSAFEVGDIIARITGPKFGPDAVALPARSGQCDPLSSLEPSARRIILNPERMFPRANWATLPPALRIGISKGDYALLLVAMLNNGKLSLMRQVRSFMESSIMQGLV